MEDKVLDVGAVITDNDVAELRKRLQNMEPDEEIVIKMEARDAHQSDLLRRELEQQGFDYQSHGGHGKEYFLIARKKGK